jgi:hypothetical protein
MTKQLIILIITLSSTLCSFGQSYIGFSGGLNNPLLYESKPDYADHLNISNIETNKRSYIEFHIKKRKERDLNIGLKTSFSNLKVNYNHYDGGLGGGKGRRIEYDTYIIHLNMALETPLIKDVFYFSFGPELAIPIYSYKKETWSNGSIIPSEKKNYSSQGKNRDGNNSIKIFYALTFEQSISKKMKFFVNLQSNYVLKRMYYGVKTLDFRLGGGIQFLLSDFHLLEKRAPKKSDSN